MKKRVLITGASGFCGRYLAQYLAASKKYTIFSGYHPRTQPSSYGKKIAIDITSESSVGKAIQDIQPHFICHLAAQSNARLSGKMIEQTYDVNIMGTMHLIRAVRQCSPKTRLLYTSSVHVYGRMMRSGSLTKETSRLWPETVYGYSKALSEMSCLDFAKRFALDVIIVRSNNLFGAGQSPDFVFSDWCRQIARIEAGLQENSISVGDLSLRRDFLPVEDGVSAYELLLERGKSGEVYNVCSGSPRPLRYYLDYLLSLSTVTIRFMVDETKFRVDDPPIVRLSNRKLKDLGWVPTKSIQNTLLMLLQFWRNNVAN